jgi:quinolinate synthase
MTGKEARDIIRNRKKELGDRLIILGHHYQKDEIIEFADYVGDSLELARKASQIETAEYIVLCGVYFMAETAAILAPGKSVFIPEKNAGCPLADMARVDDVQAAWDTIVRENGKVIPITYVNSSAELKAFCGGHDGTVCTSANARKVVAWALDRADKILFMPDMNLGKNTARSMNIPDSQVKIWDFGLPWGGLSREDIMGTRMILWKGWCPVHSPGLTVEDVDRLRSIYPGVKVMVHPETDPATVLAAGSAGSTSQMLEYISGLPKGDRLVMGTEANLVLRAARKNAQNIEIIPLKEVYCEDMAKVTLPKLATTLLGIPASEEKIRLPEAIIADARKALDMMLRI